MIKGNSISNPMSPRIITISRCNFSAWAISDPWVPLHTRPELKRVQSRRRVQAGFNPYRSFHFWVLLCSFNVQLVVCLFLFVQFPPDSWFVFCLLSQRGWHSAPVTSQLVTHHPPPAPPPPPKPPPPKPPPPPPVVKPCGMNCKITGNCFRATQRRKESANQKGVHQCTYI